MKRKLLYIAVVTMMLQGCVTGGEFIVATGVVAAVVCNTTTTEGRAEIRSKQDVPTDICGDLRDDAE